MNKITLYYILFIICAPCHAGKTTTVPRTCNELARKIYDGSLSSKALTQYAHRCLEKRIIYWKTLLQKAENMSHEKNKKQLLKKIPLYIRLKPNITPQNMLYKCSLNKDLDCRGITSIYDNHVLPTIEMQYYRRKNPFLFFYHLNHELTHIEQHVNAKTLQHKGLSNIENFYTNAQAAYLYEQHLMQSEIFLDEEKINYYNKQQEEEADMHAIKFSRNIYCIERFKEKQLNDSRDNSHKGYLAPVYELKKIQKRSKKHYKKFPAQLKKHQKIYEEWKKILK